MNVTNPGGTIYRRGLLAFYRLFWPFWLFALLVVTSVASGLGWLAVFEVALFFALVAVSFLEHRRSYLLFYDGLVVVHRLLGRQLEFRLDTTTGSLVRRPLSYVRVLVLTESTRRVKVRGVISVVSPLQQSLALRPTVEAELRALGLRMRD